MTMGGAWRALARRVTAIVIGSSDWLGSVGFIVFVLMPFFQIYASESLLGSELHLQSSVVHAFDHQNQNFSTHKQISQTSEQTTSKVLTKIWSGFVFGLLLWPILILIHYGFLTIIRKANLESMRKVLSIIPKPKLLEVIAASILGFLCGGFPSWF
jgi:hypothetical protein